jgi:hypothetical protein
VPCTTTSLIVTTRRQPTIHFRWTSTTHPVYSTFAPLAHNHLPTYLSSVAAITYIFILFTFLFSDFIPSPLLPIDDPFFSNARSFGSYRFRTRMYFVSRAPATTRRNIKKRRSKKKTYMDFTITRKFLWILLSIYEDCKARTEKDLNCLEEEDWYFF